MNTFMHLYFNIHKTYEYAHCTEVWMYINVATTTRNNALLFTINGSHNLLVSANIFNIEIILLR